MVEVVVVVVLMVEQEWTVEPQLQGLTQEQGRPKNKRFFFSGFPL